jgi:hypothetical protein
MNGAYTIKSNIKPKWHQFRFKLANAIVWLARKIHPSNPEVWAFHTQLMMDYMICGKSIVRINPMDVQKEDIDLDVTL